jgi:type III pantothenate kinase
MILAIDAGNTETAIGLFRRDQVAGHWRMRTELARTSDEFGHMLISFLGRAAIQTDAITAAAVASVVPPFTRTILDACAQWLGVTALVVDATSALPISLQVAEPLTVGADRVVNALAASRIYARDTIVVDLGTATTFDCITGEGAFLGGVIAPGVRISAETLFRRTSKLPAPDLAAPSVVIGKRTEDCIRAGVLFGAVDSIDGIVRRIKKEWPGRQIPFVVATGGLAGSIAPHSAEIERVDPMLTLHGIRIAREILSSA